jgi:hypothetical protein
MSELSDQRTAEAQELVDLSGNRLTHSPTDDSGKNLPAQASKIGLKMGDAVLSTLGGALLTAALTTVLFVWGVSRG